MFKKRKNVGGVDASAMEQAAPVPAKCPLPKFARRLGAAAFLFFLIKGLVLWVFIPLGALLWALFK